MWLGHTNQRTLVTTLYSRFVRWPRMTPGPSAFNSYHLRCLCPKKSPFLHVPVEVSEQWLGGVEPGCGLEECDAVVFADGPFAVVDGCVVQRADGDGVINVGGTTVEPFDNVVDLAVHGWHGAAGGLAALVAGEDGFALCRGEEAFGPVLG